MSDSVFASLLANCRIGLDYCQDYRMNLLQKVERKRCLQSACISKCISSSSSVAGAAPLPPPSPDATPSLLARSLPHPIMRVLNIGGRECAAMEEAALLIKD